MPEEAEWWFHCVFRCGDRWLSETARLLLRRRASIENKSPCLLLIHQAALTTMQISCIPLCNCFQYYSPSPTWISVSQTVAAGSDKAFSVEWKSSSQYGFGPIRQAFLGHHHTTFLSTSLVSVLHIIHPHCQMLQLRTHGQDDIKAVCRSFVEVKYYDVCSKWGAYFHGLILIQLGVSLCVLKHLIYSALFCAESRWEPLMENVNFCLLTQGRKTN